MSVVVGAGPVCLTLVVYSFNMLGDAMRDLLDPRLRGSGGRLDTGGDPRRRGRFPLAALCGNMRRWQTH